MSIDDDYDIPADADAVVLAPSLVSDRYVQFAPVYDGGPTMEDGAEVPLERTATPVELDQVYGALDELSAALGPDGRQRERRAVGPARRRRGQPRGQRRGAQPHADRLLAGRGDPGRRTARTCSARWTTCRPSPARWPRSTRRCGQFNDNMARSPSSSRRAGGPGRRRLELLDQALADVAGFVRDNSDLLQRTSTGSPTSPWSWSSSAPRWPRCSTSRRPRWATSRTPTTPTRHPRHPRQRLGAHNAGGRRLRCAGPARATCSCRRIDLHDPARPARAAARPSDLRPAALR